MKILLIFNLIHVCIEINELLFSLTEKDDIVSGIDENKDAPVNPKTQFVKTLGLKMRNTNVMSEKPKSNETSVTAKKIEIKRKVY